MEVKYVSKVNILSKYYKDKITDVYGGGSSSDSNFR